MVVPSVVQNKGYLRLRPVNGGQFWSVWTIPSIPSFRAAPWLSMIDKTQTSTDGIRSHVMPYFDALYTPNTTL